MKRASLMLGLVSLSRFANSRARGSFKPEGTHMVSLMIVAISS